MYIAGVLTGFFFTGVFSLFAVAGLLLRFNDALWRERMRGIVNGRARQALLEDHRGRRGEAGCVKTIDVLDGTSGHA